MFFFYISREKMLKIDSFGVHYEIILYGATSCVQIGKHYVCNKVYRITTNL